MFKTVLGSMGIIFIILLAIFILLYNKLVSIKNSINERWEKVSQQLKLKHALASNLIIVIKQYDLADTSPIEKLAKLRAIAISAKSINDKNKAENELNSCLKHLLNNSKIDNKLNLEKKLFPIKEQFLTVENQLKNCCDQYNITIKNYNNLLKSFPNNLIAYCLQYKSLLFFEVYK